MNTTITTGDKFQIRSRVFNYETEKVFMLASVSMKKDNVICIQTGMRWSGAFKRLNPNSVYTIKELESIINENVENNKYYIVPVEYDVKKV